MLIVLLVVVPVIGGILSRIFGKVGGSTVGAGIVGGAAWLIGGSLIIAGVAGGRRLFHHAFLRRRRWHRTRAAAGGFPSAAAADGVAAEGSGVVAVDLAAAAAVLAAAARREDGDDGAPARHFASGATSSPITRRCAACSASRARTNRSRDPCRRGHASRSGMRRDRGGARRRPRVMKRLSPRERALEVFGLLRVWDTEENCGVLVYLLLADRDVEIVADRGIHRVVGDEAWQAICQRMEAAFRAGTTSTASFRASVKLSAVLARHFPSSGAVPTSCPMRR